MRLFFALEAEPDTALAITHWRDTRVVADGRPVPAANFHITLAFVGDLPHAKSEHLADSVDNWVADATPVGGDLTLDSPGYWPKAGIFWLGPAHWPEALDGLAGKLRSLAGAAGARKDGKAFRPHVTLYRRCAQPPAAPTTLPAIRWHYSHCSLMESVQGRSGVHYRPLASWALSRPASFSAR